MTESKAKSTQATIKGKGGLRSAVALDETGAEIKAGADKGSIEQKAQMLEDAMNKGVAKGAKTLAEAMASISSVSTATQFGKEVGFANKLTKENAQSLRNQLLNTKDAKGNNLFTEPDLADMYNSKGELKSGAELASWISGKQAGHLSGMHGLAIGDKTVGLALGEHDVRVASTKTDLESTTTGRREEYYNNQKVGHNTDAKLQNQLENTDNNLKEATNRTKIKDRVNYESNPKNQAGDFATDIIDWAFGDEESQEAAATAAGVVGTTVASVAGAYGLEKMTKDKQGKGVVKKSYNWTRDKFDTLVGGEPSSQSTNDSNNSTSNDSNSQSNTSTDDKTNHNDSLRNYTNHESITNIDGNSNSPGKNSFMGKAGLFGFAAGAIHQLAMSEGNIGKAFDAISQEVGATWNQFRNDVGTHGLMRATTNQIGDALVGEQNRLAANLAFNAGNSMQGFSIAAGGVIDGVVRLGYGIINAGIITVQSLGSCISYDQAFVQNAQTCKSDFFYLVYNYDIFNFNFIIIYKKTIGVGDYSFYLYQYFE